MWKGNKRARLDDEALLLLSRKIGGKTSFNDCCQGIRRWPMMIAVVIVFVFLTARLFQLTVVEGKWRRELADNNRILTLPIMAQRGILTDRNGMALTQNIPIYRRQLPGTNPAELKFEPVSREQALSFLVNPTERVSYDIERNYPCGKACAAAIGYVGEGEQKGKLSGKFGAEKAYERYLTGEAGEEYLEIDASGKALRTVGVKEPQSGTTIRLTIDTGLTQVLYDAFEGRPGAAVALSPQTGEILALVSSPIFDPNNVAASLKEPNQPFFNRAVGGTYAPGSTFKIVTALAALEENSITGNTMFNDTGEITIGDFRFGNWLYDEHGRTEGEVGVVKALARSNDIFFYKTGELVGAEKLGDWAGQLGYGKLSNLTDWGEAKGLVPTPKWKLEARGERWYLGNTYHMSIGQGDVLATPLQVTTMMAAIGAKGVVCPPRMKDSQVARESGSQVGMGCKQLNLQEQTISLIKQGMVEACMPGGTGAPFFQFEPKVACKTGTAQQGGEEDLPHAWFTVLAPAENPTIALTVLVEQGGQGSQVAAPIAKQAIEYWLKK